MNVRSDYSGLINDGVLHRYVKCPICASEGRKEVANDFKPNKYVNQFKELDPRLDLEAVRSLPTYECTMCSTRYCDPWLSAAFSARFFNSVLAQHSHGWTRFYGIIDPRLPDSHDEYQTKLWAFISKLGKVESYAEMNCPFTGLLPFFRKRELGENQAYAGYERSIRAIQSAYPHPPSAEVHAPGLKRLSEYFLRRAHRKISKAPEKEKSFDDFPSKRYLIRETTSLFWGGNCMARGVTCSGISSGFLQAFPVDFKDIERERIKLDVLGFYNCLDHFFEPMAILKTAMRVSKQLIFVGHKYSELSKQHQFALGPGFDDYLRSLGWRVANISKEVLMNKHLDSYNALSISSGDVDAQAP